MGHLPLRWRLEEEQKKTGGKETTFFASRYIGDGGGDGISSVGGRYISMRYSNVPNIPSAS